MISMETKLRGGCFYVSKMFLKKIEFFFLFQINIFFGIFRLFQYVNVKNNFFKIKNILF